MSAIPVHLERRFRAEMGISFRIASCVDRLEERGDEIPASALHGRQIRQYLVPA